MDIDPTYEFNAPKFCDFEALDASEDHADEVFDFQIVGDIVADASGQDAAISKFRSSVTVQAVGLPSGRGLTTVQRLKADHAPRSEHKRNKFPSGRRQWAVYADAPHVAVAFADDSRSDASPDLRETRPVRRPVRTFESSVAAASGPSRATAVGRTLLRQPLRSVQPVAVGGTRLPGAPSDGHLSARSKLVRSNRTTSTKSTDGHRTCADENWLTVPSSSRLGHAFADEPPMGSHGSSCPISSFPVKSSKDEPQRNACRFTKVLAPPAVRSLSPAAAVVEPSTCCGPITDGDAGSLVTKSLELAKPDLCTPDIVMPPADVITAQQADASAPITHQVPVADSAEAAAIADGHRQQMHVTSVLLGDVTNAAPVTDGVSTCGKIDKSCVTFARVAGGSYKGANGLAKSTTGNFRKRDEDRRANTGDMHRFVRPNKRVPVSDRATGANAHKVGRLGPRSGIGHSKDTAERQPLQPAASRLNSLRPTNGGKPSADPSYSRPGLARVKRDADRQLTAAATAASHASSRLLGTGAVKEVGAAAKPAGSARQPPIPPARSTGRQVFATECRRPQRQQQQQPQKQQPLPGARQQPKERSQSSRPPAAAAPGHFATLSHSTAVMSTTVLAAVSHVHPRSPGHITRYKPLVIRRSSRPPTKPMSPHFSSKVSKKSGFAV